MCCRHNLLLGTYKEWKKLLTIVVVIALFCSSLYMETFNEEYWLEVGQLPGMLDYFLHIFEGVASKVADDDTPFVIPIIWLLVSSLILLPVSFYPTQEFDTLGTNTIFRYKSRYHWWMGKVIWNILTTLIVYLLLIITIMAFSLITAGSSFLEFSPAVHPYLFTEANEFILKPSYLLAIIGVPAIVYLSVGLVHMTISLVFGPVIAYIILIAFYVASAYFNTPLLFLSGSMLKRYATFSQGGIPPLIYLFISLGFAIVAIVFGHFIFQRRDILKRNQ